MTETNADAPKLVGTVRWYDPNKGYGFILDSSGRDVFMHISAVAVTSDDPFAGDRVLYRIGRSPNGKPAAVEIVVVS